MKPAVRRVLVVAAVAAFLAVFCHGAEAGQKYRVTASVSLGGAVMTGAALVVWGVSVAYSADAGQNGEDKTISSAEERPGWIKENTGPGGIEVRLVTIKF